MARPLGQPKLGGRKKGIPNRVNAKREAEIAASGLTPLDYLLSLMRNEANDEAIRIDAAKAVAPYVHPRLSSVEANLTGHVTLGSALDALDG